ncbi:MAG: outer membrane beta-barrel protein [Candidatus Eisenbacteria bacterium]|nr:outer membrane beta-barrel protein [Candidatus Eisenbacteria bacterium]
MKSFSVAGIVLFLLLAGGAAVADEMDLGLKAIEGRLGVVIPENYGTNDLGATFMIGGSLDLGTLMENVGIEAGGEFWTKGESEGAVDVRFTNLAFLGNLKYILPLEGGFKPFGFGGFGFHFWNSSVDCDECFGPYWDGDYDDSGVEFGINLGAGADLHLEDSSITPTGRAGININGGADYFFIQGGVKLNLSQ